MRAPHGVPLLAPMSGGYSPSCSPSVSALLHEIHEDLGILLFADHIRALTESFDSKLADEGNPLVRQLGRYLN